MKSLAKEKYTDAEPSYLAMATEINPAFGINERIKSRQIEAVIEENKRLDGMTAYEKAVEELAKLKVRKK